tara:strand:- start:5405 stop:6337 length:933 start_codon:yes stop_codon:yes gene_type:complete
MILSLLAFSFICSLSLIILTQKHFLSKGYVDSINDRSSHSSIATRSGGVSVFLTLFLIATYNYVSGNTIFDYSIIIPLALLVIVGLYDDIYSVDFKLKFLFQIIAAKIIIDNGLIIDNIHGILGLYELNRIVAQLLTIFIIVAIINAINFIDGIDGLAISIIAVFIILFEFFALNISPFYNVSLIIISALLPLYYFNFRKSNKVFLGDAGSLFLGGIVSIYVVYILNNEYLIKPIYDIHKILFVLSILVYPIIDIIRIFCVRIYNKKSPFIPDKNHIHHLILNKVKNHIITVVILVSISLGITVLLQGLF